MEGTAATKPVTGHNGTFSLTVNQLFPSHYSPGLFTVVVTGPGGAQASADFMVIPGVLRFRPALIVRPLAVRPLAVRPLAVRPASTTGLPGVTARPGRPAARGRRR